ncbi:hypothetical protein [Sphaerobacter sp.]|uniref:hypothetical protein n=1 Tax=Sphaerobacter sp. TaxID=2099654 RepID=UPI0025D823C4|nr:hypothetical protein [Sphaerobacter sp.]
MCVLCGVLWTEDHWSEAGAEEIPDEPDGTVVMEIHMARRGQRLRDRARRARMASTALRAWGITLQDWEGSCYIVRDRKGNSAVVPDLAQVWEAAEDMLGAPLDPLDPNLLAALRRGA